MTLAVILICAALVLYTTAIFSERIKGKLERWMLVMFFHGFIADIVGTFLMAYFRSCGRSLSLHIFFGILALVIMATHLFWACRVFEGSESSQKLFHKHSWKAWLVWMAAFITGWLI
jgi:uncharacterized repeat protein (TIGR03987 family)